jgi:hypothetical protein
MADVVVTRADRLGSGPMRQATVRSVTSAFLASLAEVMEAGAIGQAIGDSYPPLNSLLFSVLAVIGLGGLLGREVRGVAGEDGEARVMR